MKPVYIVILILVLVVGVMIKVIHWFLNRRVTFRHVGDSPMFFARGNNKTIQAAMENARATIDHFIRELQNTIGEFEGSVKVKIEDDGEVEYMWLDQLSYDNGIFHGNINNDPQSVRNVKFGYPWQVHRDEIADWMYRKDGILYGNYTLKSSIQHLSEEKQLAALKEFGDVDDLREKFTAKHTAKMQPLVSALAKSMTPDVLIKSIERSALPEEKKKEMIDKINKKKADQRCDK
jgi:uncharacterized protein YegJ (DUF2314 family)